MDVDVDVVVVECSLSMSLSISLLSLHVDNVDDAGCMVECLFFFLDFLNFLERMDPVVVEYDGDDERVLWTLCKGDDIHDGLFLALCCCCCFFCVCFDLDDVGIMGIGTVAVGDEDDEDDGDDATVVGDDGKEKDEMVSFVFVSN